MVNLKKAVPSASNTGNGVAASVLPISYLQAGNSQIPVLIEDMRDMAPKVIVSEGMLRCLVTNLRPLSLIDMKRNLQQQISKVSTTQELVEMLAAEVQFHTSIQLIQAYMLETSTK